MKMTIKIFLNILNIILKAIIVIVALSIQLALLYFIFIYLQRFQLLYYLVSSLAIIPAIKIYNSDQNISFKFSWILLILIVPYIGVIFYLFFGKGKTLPKRKANKVKDFFENKLIYNDNIDELKDNDTHKYATLLNSITRLPLYKNTQTKFINDGKMFFDNLIEDIKNAHEYIFLEYFIFSDGKDLETLKQVLFQKADEGVEIKIIYDDIGSKKALKPKTVDEINSHKNIKMIGFNPIGLVFSLRLNYRNHRKIAIIDGKVAYCGGVNIADEYTHKIEKFGFWRDNANRYIGDAIYSFLLIFISDWYMSTSEKLDFDFYKKSIVSVDGKNSYVFPFLEGPTIEKNPAYSLFSSLINNVDHTLYISTPYFIIDKTFIDSLCFAAESGVDVRLLIPHIPDKKLVYFITCGHLGKLIKSGVRVYVYIPGFNHAKNFIIDDNVTFNGTINLDYRSLFLHFECGALHIDEQLNKIMKEDFLKALNQSEEISYEAWKKRSIFKKLIEFLSVLIAPLL